MENIQFGRCGPVGGKLSRESTRDSLFMSAGTALFLIAFSVARRAFLAGESALAIPAAGAAVLFLGLAAWPIVRIARRSDDWALAQAATLAFFFVFNLNEKFPRGSPWAFAAVLLPLVPAGVLVWSYIRIFRRADEMQRRIVYEALGVAFVTTLSVTITGAFLQSAGLPKLGWVWIAGVLVVSLTIGLALAHRRYR